MTIELTKLLHARSLNGRFIEMEWNVGKKKLNLFQGSNFFKGSLKDKDNLRALVQFRGKI